MLLRYMQLISRAQQLLVDPSCVGYEGYLVAQTLDGA
jgi:hypothetical protein